MTTTGVICISSAIAMLAGCVLLAGRLITGGTGVFGLAIVPGLFGLAFSIAAGCSWFSSMSELHRRRRAEKIAAAKQP